MHCAYDGPLATRFALWECAMNAVKIAAIVLVLAGALALAYGGFSYTKKTTAVDFGPLQLQVKEKKSVNVPVWAGVAAIVVGGLLLVSGGKRS
jgi:hypothetical protein